MNAVLSHDLAYRYWLHREVAPAGPVYAFFGVNPSTADHTTDDHTVRKWIGFTKRWGGSRFVVGNAFALRATDVTELARALDPFGPDNDAYLAGIIEDADFLVPCWGREAKVPKHLRYRFAAVMNDLRTSGKPVLQFGRCGPNPPHPLTLGYETPLVPA